MYCLDTYALFELFYGNPKFSEFFVEKSIVTNWTLIEFFKTMVKEHEKEKGEYWFQKMLPLCKEVHIEILKKAVIFQSENKKTNMSLFDAVGYMYAQEHALLFVTGDKEFKGREGVLFIQK